MLRAQMRVEVGVVVTILLEAGQATGLVHDFLGHNLTSDDMNWSCVRIGQRERTC